MSLLETIADLEAEHRQAAIDRYLALLDKPALGTFEPHVSRRRQEARAALERDVRDLAAARGWKPGVAA
jgi:hypothetical protein